MKDGRYGFSREGPLLGGPSDSVSPPPASRASCPFRQPISGIRDISCMTKVIACADHPEDDPRRRSVSGTTAQVRGPCGERAFPRLGCIHHVELSCSMWNDGNGQ